MTNLYDSIYKLLKQKSEFVSEDGSLLKNKIIEYAYKLDENLINLLLSDEKVKEVFFKNIGSVCIFDERRFIKFINNKDFLPDNYTAFKNKVGLLDSNDNLILNSNDIVLSRPYKDCTLEFDSTDENENRDEIFYNEILGKDQIDKLLDKKVFSNFKKHTSNGEQALEGFNKDENGIIRDNLVIKGNNLLALYSLLPKYEGQIKLMYWDILYNTESDKVPYADKFKHSTWLTMMKNRLEVAYKLLDNNGVICMQCDDNEQAYLTVLCDELFGRENRVNSIVIEMASTGGLKRSHKDKRFLKTKEYILIYSKHPGISLDSLYDERNIYDGNYDIVFDENGIHKLIDDIKTLNPLYEQLDKKQYLGFEDIYEYLLLNKDKIFRRHGPSSWALDNLQNGEILREDESRPTRNQVIKVYDNNGENYELLMRIRSQGGRGYERLEPLAWNYYDGKLKLLRGDLRKDYYKDMGNVSKEGDVKLPNGKKPERLLKDLILAFTDENDIILDAYLGSGTTAAVAHKMGRMYIGIEQLNNHYSKAITRINGVINGDSTGVSGEVGWTGGGEFISLELMKQNELIIDKISGTNSTEDLISIYNEIKDSEFLSYQVDINSIEDLEKSLNDLSINELKDFLIKILDKNALYVNYSDIEDVKYNVSDEDKKFNDEFYN